MMSESISLLELRCTLDETIPRDQAEQEVRLMASRMGVTTTAMFNGELLIGQPGKAWTESSR